MKVHKRYAPLTPEELATIKPLTKTCGWEKISRKTGISFYRILSHFDPVELARQRAKNAEREKRNRGRRRRSGPAGTPLTFDIPPAVLADRDRRATLRALCTNPNVILMGDPIR